MTLEQELRRLAGARYSKTAAAAVLGIPPRKLREIAASLPDIEWKPRHAGWTPEKRQRMIAAGRIHEHTVRGVTGTLGELLTHFGLPISVQCVNFRMKAGATLEEAMFTPPAFARRKFKVRGVTGSIAELIQYFGLEITDHSVRRRLSKGQSIEEALFEQSRPWRVYTVRGISGTVAQLCAAFDTAVSPKGVYARMAKGLPIEEALFQPPRDSRAPAYTVRGVTGSLKELWQHFKPAVKLSGLYYRLSTGMPIEEALFAPDKRPPRKNKPKGE